MSAVSATPISGRDLQGSDAERQSVQAGLDLARELRRRWEGGERPAAEELLQQHPDLSRNGEAALEVVYEEYCQREAAGDSGAEQDILRRFPHWAGPLRVMIDCHRHLIHSQQRPQFPNVGDSLGEFRLLEEIASGATGRVYLAVQTALADRPVILKITPLDGAEHLALARLQHTNIVPLYTALDLPGSNLRILCMPYFGRAALASVLEDLGRVPVEARTGAMLVEAIDRLQGDAPQSAPDGGPRQMLAQASYVEATCWIIACLADALQFAHDRCLVHLDLKPSNILLATDGQPMLLDFHLAREPVHPDGPPPESLGGTPAYMPPEQHDALSALREGRGAAVAVDGRADLYAIGAILYESLSGHIPAGADAPPLEGCNPQVSRGLSDIVTKCLKPRPEDRYPSATALAEDLRRHLMHRPLTGVPNRSIRERWMKWQLRRPSALRLATLLVLLAGSLLVVLAATLQNVSQRERQAEIALSDGHRQISHGQFAEAVEAFARGLALARGLPFQSDLKRELGRQLEAARRLGLVQQTHNLAEQVRRLPGMESPPADYLVSLSEQCRELWNRRSVLMQGGDGPVSSQLEADMKDVAMFAAMLSARKARGTSGDPAGFAEAIRVLDEAEATFGPSAVLEYERRRCRRALGLPEEASEAGQVRPQSAWEHCALGRAHLEAGDLTGAAEQLAAARALEPGSLWANYYYGLYAYRLGNLHDAVAAFSVCIGVNPSFADCFYNRALAYEALGQRQNAIQDFQRALALAPDHPALAQLAEDLR